MFLLYLQFDSEFRRFALPKDNKQSFEDFLTLVGRLHGLQKIPFDITYTDPEGDLLPINNNENYARALTTARPVLRLCIQRRGLY